MSIKPQRRVVPVVSVPATNKFVTDIIRFSSWKYESFLPDFCQMKSTKWIPFTNIIRLKTLSKLQVLDWINSKNSKWRLTYSDLVQTANFHLPPEYFDYYSKGDHWKIAYLIVLFADEKGVNKPSAVVWIQSPQKRIDQLHHLFSTLDNIVYNNPFVFQERTQPWKYVVELEMDTRETDFV